MNSEMIVKGTLESSVGVIGEDIFTECQEVFHLSIALGDKLHYQPGAKLMEKILPANQGARYWIWLNDVSGLAREWRLWALALAGTSSPGSASPDWGSDW